MKFENIADLRGLIKLFGKEIEIGGNKKFAKQQLSFWYNIYQLLHQYHKILAAYNIHGSENELAE